MAEFVIDEAIDVDVASSNDNNEGNIESATVSDDEFIDDRPVNENNDFYPYFTNVSRSYDDAMQDFKNVDDLEARNYFASDDDEEDEINFCLTQKLKYLRKLLLIHTV